MFKFAKKNIWNINVLAVVIILLILSLSANMIFAPFVFGKMTRFNRKTRIRKTLQIKFLWIKQRKITKSSALLQKGLLNSASAEERWISRIGRVIFILPARPTGVYIIDIAYMSIALRRKSRIPRESVGLRTAALRSGVWICVIGCSKPRSMSERNI